MLWRKWFVRTLVFGTIGLCTSAGFVYQRWTDPAVVKQQVIGKLQEMYPGAIITIDSARLRLLGGIQVNDLRMFRRDDPDRVEFFQVPSAILYHDKEKLLDGQVVLRKVELHRPRFRLVHNRDGTWNVQGIVGERQENLPLPTMVVQHGNISLEDHQLGQGSSVEINDVQLSFINDPLNLVNVVGAASSPVLGAVQLKGTINRETKEMSAKAKAKGMQLSSDFLQKLPLLGSKLPLADLAMEARVDVEASLTYRQKEPLDYQVNVRLTHGKVRHPKLPLPLEEVQATIDCNNGTVRVHDFQARSKQTIIKGKAVAQVPKFEQNFEADMEVQHLNVDNELAEKLPEKLHNLQQLFQAVGVATLHVNCARRNGTWVNVTSGSLSRISLLPEDGRVCFVKFQYPLEKITGNIDWTPQQRLIEVDVTGYTHQRPIVIQGFWQGDARDGKAEFNLGADDVPIDDGLIGALPEKFQKLTNAFHPSGKIGFKAHLARDAEHPQFRNEYHIHLHDGGICWKEFPYALEQVSGVLDIYPHHWEFHDGRGMHGGGEVLIDGHSVSGQSPTGPGHSDNPADEEGLSLKITGRNLMLDDSLHQALKPMPQMARSWEIFRPSGKLNFGATVLRPPGPYRAEELDVFLDVHSGSLEPLFFPYALNDINGQFRYHKNRLEVKKASASHKDTKLKLDAGSVDLLPGGGHYTDLKDIVVSKLKADDEFIKALPKPLRSVTQTLKLSEPVDVKTRLVIKQGTEAGSLPDVWWDGKLQLRKTGFNTGIDWKEVDGELACCGRHNGYQMQGLVGNMLVERASVFKQPFTKVHVDFHVEENAPEKFFLDVHAPIFGGDLTGQACLEFTSNLRYEVNLTASQINLQDFGRHNLGQKSQISGMALGRLHLTGLGSSFDTLDGNGRIDIPNGHLYNLPLLLDLLKFLGLRWPDRTAFEELHALFSIHGSRVAVQKLDLTGSAVSLTGKGDFNIDGSDLNLNFYPAWGRVDQLFPAELRFIFPAINKNILTIEVRGKVDDNPDHLKFNKKLVPAVTDPIKSMLRQ